jgi:hypothetical protein
MRFHVTINIMTTLTHVVSASYIGVRVANIMPQETDYIFISLLSSGILDIDHIFMLIKNRSFFKKNGLKNTLHKARSYLHELIGFLIIGIITLILSFVDLKLALVVGVLASVHLVEDVLMGISIPFNPIDKTEINLIKQSNRIKIVTDVVILLIFGVLWIRYLAEVN